MTISTSADGKLFEGQEVFDIAMKFANDCGTVALGSRDFNELKRLYKDFAIKIAHHVEAEKRAAKLQLMEDIEAGKIPYFEGVVKSKIEKTAKLELITGWLNWVESGGGHINKQYLLEELEELRNVSQT